MAEVKLDNLFKMKPGHVHVMGICGVGAAGIAWLLHLRGWRVTGCDKIIQPLMGAFFRRHDIQVYSQHDVNHLADCQAVVYSAAIHADEAELVLARKMGLIVQSRGQCLAGWISGLNSVAVCGTHGKTTTSCFTTRLFQCIGENPLWCLGGYTSKLVTNAGPTNIQVASDVTAEAAQKILAVAEADESDGTLAYDAPAVTVITNIDLDHLDYFHNEEDLERVFRAVVEQTRRGIAVCADHPRAMRVATYFQNGPILTFGLGKNAVIRAENLRRTAEGTTFELVHGHEILTTVELKVPGDHNVCNALGAFSAGLLMGFDAHSLAEKLGEACEELPSRRFQWLTPRDAQVRMLTDYAHHPVEIKALMSIAKMQSPRRLRVVFQPHRYSRTRALLHEFPEAFEGAQELILLPVYEASERRLPGGEIQDLYAELRANNPVRSTLLARSVEEVAHYLQHSAQVGDMILVVGAGDIVQLGTMLKDGPTLPLTQDPVEKLLTQFCPDDATLTMKEPLAPHTFFRVGGVADFAITIRSLPSLCALCTLCNAYKVPLYIQGGGSNTWFSDLGLSGILCSLRGEPFEIYSREDNLITVGASIVGAELLARLESEGLGGLEFLQGIPGNVGGWAYVNVGAHGQAIWDHITSVRAVTADGQLRHIHARDIRAGYRAVHGLRGVTLISVTFALTPDTPENIHAKRVDCGTHRVQLSGLRTCGSLFRNPDAETAVGKCLDELGAKAWSIGGASVAPQHANVIVSGKDCTASDLLALTYRLKSAFYNAYNRTISPEIRGIEAYADGISLTPMNLFNSDLT